MVGFLLRFQHYLIDDGRGFVRRKEWLWSPSPLFWRRPKHDGMISQRTEIGRDWEDDLVLNNGQHPHI